LQSGLQGSDHALGRLGLGSRGDQGAFPFGAQAFGINLACMCLCRGFPGGHKVLLITHRTLAQFREFGTQVGVLLLSLRQLGFATTRGRPSVIDLLQHACFGLLQSLGGAIEFLTEGLITFGESRLVARYKRLLRGARLGAFTDILLTNLIQRLAKRGGFRGSCRPGGIDTGQLLLRSIECRRKGGHLFAQSVTLRLHLAERLGLLLTGRDGSLPILDQSIALGGELLRTALYRSCPQRAHGVGNRRRQGFGQGVGLHALGLPAFELVIDGGAAALPDYLVDLIHRQRMGQPTLGGQSGRSLAGQGAGITRARHEVSSSRAARIWP